MVAHLQQIMEEHPRLELARRLRQQEAVADLGQAALDGTEASVLMDKACALVSENLGTEIVAVLEIQPGGALLRVRAAVGLGADVVGRAEFPVTDETPAGLALHSDEPIIFRHLPTDVRFPRPAILPDHGVMSGMSVAIPARQVPFGVLGVHTCQPRDFSSHDTTFLRSVANALGAAIARQAADGLLDESRRLTERHLRYEQALAQCAQALLMTVGEIGAERAVRELFEVIEGDYAFLERNGLSESIGLTSEPVFQLDRGGGGSPAVSAIRPSLPWAALPTIRTHLERGETFSYRMEDLTDSEREVLLAARVRVAATVDVPIVVAGEWVGMLGFAGKGGGRGWDQVDLQVMETVAKMIGAAWEQGQTSQQLQAELAAKDRRISYERALRRCSAALLCSDRDESLEPAIEALFEATQATSVLVERNIDDPVEGLCSEVQFWLTRADSGYDPSYWNRMPWSRMPMSYKLLSRGRPHAFLARSLVGIEAETYAHTNVKSEIDLPIMINGEWVGIVGFTDEEVEREWKDELPLLRTAADMIGAFWERRQARRRLEELVGAKDEFVASVSHELRTPLTAVVGLTQELREGYSGFDAGEVAEFLDLIADQSAEVTAIVHDLLVVARSDIGRLSVELGDVDLRKSIAAVLRVLPKPEQSTVAVAGAAPVAQADETRVRQILRNLVSNAVRYGGQRREVLLAADEQWAIVEVRDDGAGIPPEHRQLIFEPYHRVHDRSGQPASVGLGLTVSRQLARLMGGDLVYSYADGWSSFVCTLPAAGRSNSHPPRPNLERTASASE